jgi:hypothetical protein
MAILTHPMILCMALFLFLRGTPADIGVDTRATSENAAAAVLLDTGLDVEGRWLQVHGTAIVRAAHPVATWQADVSALGMHAEFAHDASGFSASLDAGGLLSSLVGRTVLPVFQSQR